MRRRLFRCEEKGLREGANRRWFKHVVQLVGGERSRSAMLTGRVGRSHSFLVVATAWGSHHGGINSFNVGFCRALALANHRVTCLVVQPSEGDVADATEAGVTLVGTEAGPGLDEFPQQRLLLPRPELPVAVDFVVGHGRITGPQAFQLRTSRFPEAGYVHFVHMHADTIDGEKEPPTDHSVTEKRMQTELALLEHAIVPAAVGPRLVVLYESELLARRPNHRLHCFTPGLADFPSLSGPATHAHSAPRVLVVARAEDNKLKGIDYAVDRVCRVRRTLLASEEPAVQVLAGRIQVYVLGASDERHAETEQRRLRGRTGKADVRVKPYSLERRAVAEELRAASLVLMLSIEEGFGLSALEALSVGTPILVTGQSGFAEVLRLLDGGHGRPYVVDVDRADENADAGIERAIQSVLLNLAEHRARTATLRAAYDAAHSWATAITDFVRALELASDRRSPGEAPGTPGAPTPADDFAVAVQFQAASSMALAAIEAPSETGWISRPEEGDLLGRLRAKPDRPLALLGPPGSGKSALIARLVRAVENEEADEPGGRSALLLLKADLLPSTARSAEQLFQHLGLSGPVADVVEGMAALRPVLVLFDQLDALSALVDRFPERLAILLDTAERVMAIPNVTVVLSCRTFDFDFDPRFRRLQCDRVELGPLPEEGVAAAMKERGLPYATIEGRIKDVLRWPQWLRLALDSMSPGAKPGFHDEKTLVSAFLERAAERSKDASRTREMIGRLARRIDEREELWLHVDVLAKEDIDSRELAAIGVVRMTPDAKKVALCHQLVFEHVRAGQLVAEGSLADYVRLREGSAFVRPLLGPALSRLRSVDLARYHAELRALFTLPELRAYIRRYLLEFLGAVDEPTEAELQLIFEHVQNSRWVHWAMQAVHGRPRWFAHLKGAQLGAVLRGPLFPALALLTDALKFDRPSVVDLLRRHVMPRLDAAEGPDIARGVGWLLGSWRPWDDDAQRFASALASRTDSLAALEPLSLVLHRLVKDAPTFAVELLARWIDASRGDGETILRQLEAWWPPEGLHLQASTALIEQLWPRVVRRLEAGRIAPRAARYAATSARGWDPEDDDGQAMPGDFRLAMQGFARSSPEAFLALLERDSASELMAVHAMLVAGLSAVPEAQSDACVRYVCGDNRRLRLGDWEPVLSLRFLAVLGESLAPEQIARVRVAVEAFDLHVRARDDADEEALRIQDNARWRRRLLHALGVDRSDDQLAAETDELLSDARRGRFGGFRAVESPISPAELAGLGDDGLVRAFSEFPDSTEWRHPTDWSRGGSIELCRALAEVVPTDPTRFAKVARIFDAATHARPATTVFRALAKTELPPAEFEAVFLDLSARGVFVQEEYANDAAYAWAERTRANGPPSEAVVDVLASWLHDVDGSEDGHRDERDDTSPSHPLLFGRYGFETLPGGNFPTLHALTLALLLGEQPRYERWAMILEAHLLRNERSQVWRAMARNLRWLVHSEPRRGERFLSSLFSRHASVLGSIAGLHLVAAVRWQIPMDSLVRWLGQVLNTGWRHAEQGYGELLTCVGLLPGAPDTLRAELTTAVSSEASPAVRAGVVHCLVELWEGPARAQVTGLLVEAVRLAGEPYVTDALSGIFRQRGFFADEHTDRVLEALIERPDLLRARDAMYLPEQLLKLLPHNASVVAEVTRQLVMNRGPAERYYGGEELIGISLFLQRLGGDSRRRGLELLDMLYEQETPEASRLLQAVGTLETATSPPVGTAPS